MINVINHFLVIHRSKKERQHQYSEKKLHSLYAPLLVQSELLEREIEAYKSVSEPGTDDEYKRLKSRVQGHYSNNMMGIQGNIVQLISDNYGLINGNDKEYIMSFVRGIQEVRFMVIDGGNLAFVNAKKCEEKHPLDLLLESITLLRTNLNPSVERLKLEIYS